MKIIANPAPITTLDTVFIFFSCMKKAFTLIEIVIVLIVISILMAATMSFGSNRIVDLKAQSLKEHFVGYYNEIFRQNLTSSFRDGIKYQSLTVAFATGVSYSTDHQAPISDQQLSDIAFSGLLLDNHPYPTIDVVFAPYVLGCSLAAASATWSLFSFHLIVPQNGKQYCFEIASQTCKLIETTCN